MKNGPKISKHSSGRYYTTLTLDGKKKFIYGGTEQEVRDQWLELRYMSSQGYNVTDNPRMDDYAVRWYNLYKKGKGAIKTRKMYMNIVNTHIIPALGHKRVKSITTSDIQSLLNQTTSSKSLQHKVRLTVSQIFRKAQGDRLIAHNPVIGTDPVDAQEPERNFYTPEQRAILLEVLHDHPIFPLVFTLLNTGMRATEALALLRNRDLDLGNCRIHVRESTEFLHAQPLKKPTKTKRGVRTIPIPPAFADWMRGYLKTVKSLYVFPGPDGGQMGESWLVNMQRKANRWLAQWFDANPEMDEHRFKLWFRSLRHTYCTELFDQEIDEVSAAAIMGHTVSVMREIYTHIQKGRQQKTVDKIENLYGDIHELPLAKSRKNV